MPQPTASTLDRMAAIAASDLKSQRHSSLAHASVYAGLVNEVDIELALVAAYARLKQIATDLAPRAQEFGYGGDPEAEFHDWLNWVEQNATRLRRKDPLWEAAYREQSARLLVA
jgi:hypothetical protein